MEYSLSPERIDRMKRQLMRESAILSLIPRAKPTRWQRLVAKVHAARNWLARKIGTPDIFADE